MYDPRDLVVTDESLVSMEERIALLLALEQINGLTNDDPVFYKLDDIFSVEELRLMKNILLKNPPSKDNRNPNNKLSNEIFKLLLHLSKKNPNLKNSNNK